jgi:hypothetical protein
MRAQVVEIFSRGLGMWLPGHVLETDENLAPDGASTYLECKVSFKDGTKRGTKYVSAEDRRAMRWCMSAWLQDYHLSEYAPALRDEGYGVHPGACARVAVAVEARRAGTGGLTRGDGDGVHATRTRGAGFLCAVPSSEIGALCETLRMKKPHARLFRQALAELTEPREPPPSAVSGSSAMHDVCMIASAARGGAVRGAP